jgi:hypothetical protein
MSAPARLRLDKSRNFSTIHGERPPGDRHQFAHFCQDGIFYDAQGLHLDDLIEDEDIRALVERRLKRQAKTAPKEEPAADAGDGGGDDEAGSLSSEPVSLDDVNLEAWLRGEANYPWFSVTKLVRDRYHQNITKTLDMIEFLVIDEKLVPVEGLAPKFKELLKPKAA